MALAGAPMSERIAEAPGQLRAASVALEALDGDEPWTTRRHADA